MDYLEDVMDIPSFDDVPVNVAHDLDEAIGILDALFD